MRPRGVPAAFDIAGGLHGYVINLDDLIAGTAEFRRGRAHGPWSRATAPSRSPFRRTESSAREPGAFRAIMSSSSRGACTAVPSIAEHDIAALHSPALGRSFHLHRLALLHEFRGATVGGE
jgi:hypothetical protein